MASIVSGLFLEHRLHCQFVRKVTCVLRRSVEPLAEKVQIATLTTSMKLAHANVIAPTMRLELPGSIPSLRSSTGKVPRGANAAARNTPDIAIANAPAFAMVPAIVRPRPTF